MNFPTKIAAAIQIVAILTVLLDIPVARQIISFIYISFLPGFLILKILKLNLKSVFEEFPISMGLSIAFSMFLGLAVNEMYPLLGMSAPLSVLPLLVTMGTVLLVLTFVADRTHDGFVRSYALPNPKQLIPFVLLAIVPFLSILGTVYHSSLTLILMASAIALLAIVAIVFRKSLPFAFFPIALAVIGISLVFQREFISQNLLGYDTFGEFFVYRYTDTNSFWNAYLSLNQSELRDYNSMLSVTILPTIYSKLMNIPGEWVFKVLYFLVYSFVPLTMYEMYKHNFGKALAFLGALYFVMFPRFYGEERRQIIGEFFLVLMLFMILTSSFSTKKRELLLGIFGVALVVSHYSTFYVFIFCAIVAWFALFVTEKLTIRHEQNSAVARTIALRHVLTARVLLVILAFGFVWYAFVSTSLAQTFLSFSTRLLTSTFSSGFFNLGSRGGTVAGFVSPSLTTLSLVSKADYYISKIPYLLIGLGLIALVKNRKKLNMPSGYIPMVFAATFILVLTFVLPSLADSFVEERFFHLMLIFSAPLCFYGGAVILAWLPKHFITRKQARSLALGLLVVLLVVVFFFKAGVAYELAGDLSPGVSTSFSFTPMLTSRNPQVLASLYSSYVPDCDVMSAGWLYAQIPSNSTLYADFDASQHVIRGYALRTISYDNLFSNGTSIAPNSYVYLRTLNVQGYYVNSGGAVFNMTKISNQLEYGNKIYSDGGSQIFFFNFK